MQSNPEQRVVKLTMDMQVGDPGRLTTSLAESICVRASIKPATFPFKVQQRPGIYC